MTATPAEAEHLGLRRLLVVCGSRGESVARAVNGGYGEELRCAALATAELHREDYTLNWRSMLARGIAVVGPTVQLELDVQAMYRTHDTPTPPE